MAYTLEEFAANCREALQSDSGPGGRDKVREYLQRVLRDEAFLDTYLGSSAAPERQILYEDNGPKQGFPHDHGPTWAIYGQAAGETEMTDWRMVTPPEGDQPGKVEMVRTYRLQPGDAKIYEAGDVHAPYREAPTKLIRIEGQNTDKIERTPIESV
jgi:hypothetical protein